jgi:sulfite exporter TauE/SafE
MWALLVTGLLGSFHCAGMCGGFVLALDRPGARLRRLGVQGLFHLGKATTYILLGAGAGLVGVALVRAPWLPIAQEALAVVAGVLMVLFGLQLLQVLRELPLGSWFGPDSAYGRAFRAVVNLRGAVAPLAVGALTGLLPCPLVYAFLAEALRRASLLEAMAVMALLGLASAPALLLVVWLGGRLGPALRRRVVRISGAVIVVLGLVTLLRGLWPEALHALGGDGGHAH